VSQLRLKQVALVTTDLDTVLDDLAAVPAIRACTGGGLPAWAFASPSNSRPTDSGACNCTRRIPAGPSSRSTSRTAPTGREILELDAGRIEFTGPTDARGDGLSAVLVRAADQARALSAATARGLPVGAGEVTICGTRFVLQQDRRKVPSEARA
jgi:hypothetical protein